MIVILSIFVLIYVVTIGHLIYGYKKVPNYEIKETIPKTFFAIVVPFRNESQNLPALLESFKSLNYPVDLFEIILIDDFSEDDSVRQIYNWRMENGIYQMTLLENLRVSNSPKKDAISRAIPIIKNDWVITTDADCIVHENWLRTLDDYIQNHEVSMIVGSVKIHNPKSFIHHFQQNDLASLQGATIGSFGLELGFMCNGANFCYTKSLFSELNGFLGNNKMASGDDVFMLQKAIAKSPEKVHFLKSKSNIVSTKPLNKWSSLFQQHVRWASKTGSYKSVFGKDLALIVFGGNLAMVVGFILMYLRLLPYQQLLVLFFIKFSIDYILLYKANRYLTGRRMHYLILSCLLYPFFSTAVALYSLIGTYKWKGRKF